MSEPADAPDETPAPQPAVPQPAAPHPPALPQTASLSDVLRVARRHVADSLLDAAGEAALHEVLAEIPGTMSPFWGLETRLGTPRARMDVLWEVKQGSLGHARLAGTDGGLDADPARAAVERLIAGAPLWGFLRRFAQQWPSKAGAEGHACVRNVWMEVDTASLTDPADLAAGLAAPCLFWGSVFQVAGGDRTLLSLLPTLAAESHGLSVDGDRLARIVAALPEGATVFQQGAMGARAQPTVRLCVNNIAPDAVADWLRAIGWPGDLAAAERLMAWVGAEADAIAPSIDVLPDAIGPKLGLEVYPPSGTLDMSALDNVFDWLGETGLARLDKLRGLRAFPHFQKFCVGDAFKHADDIVFPSMVQRLNRLKLVVRGSAVAEAKAYLAVYRPGMNVAKATRGITSHEAMRDGGWFVL